MRKTALTLAFATSSVLVAAPVMAEDVVAPEPVPVIRLAQVPAHSWAEPPKRIRKRGLTLITGANPVTNAGQPITTEIRPLMRWVASLNEVEHYRVLRGADGQVVLRTYGQRLRLVILQSAPATAEYKAYAKRTVYINGKRRG